MIQPPPEENIHAGIAALIQVGALDAYEQMTKFGQIALKFSLDVRLVKALIYSIIMRCYEPVMRVVAMLSVKPPFQIGTSNESRKQIGMKKVQFAHDAADSDYRLLFNLYDKIYGLDTNIYHKYDYCKTNYISYAVMQEAKETIESIKRHFKELDFQHTQSNFAYGAVNVNQGCWQLINACFVGSFYPNTSYINSKNGQFYIESLRMEEIIPHNSSVLSRKPKVSENIMNKSVSNWIVYKEKTKSENSPIVRINASAIVSPMAMVVFAGSEFEIQQTPGGAVIVIDGLVKMTTDRITSEQVQETRRWVSTQYNKIIEYPETFAMSHEEGRKLQKLNNILQLCWMA